MVWKKQTNGQGEKIVRVVVRVRRSGVTTTTTRPPPLPSTPPGFASSLAPQPTPLPSFFGRCWVRGSSRRWMALSVPAARTVLVLAAADVLYSYVDESAPWVYS